MTTRSIFIKNATLIDFAWLGPQGPRGHSYSVDILWVGETDNAGMVMDFSAAKSLAKKVIDRDYDHRLWVTHSMVFNLLEPYPLTENTFVSNINSGNLQSDSFILSAPTQNICVFSDSFLSAEKNILDKLKIEKHISDTLKREFPASVKEIKITLNDAESISQPHYFSYTHSLPCHLGNCQRFHGHSYILEVFKKRDLCIESSKTIAAELNHCYFVSSRYLYETTECNKSMEILNALGIDYSSPEQMAKISTFTSANYVGSQGSFLCILPKKRVVSLPCESTIENLAQHIHERFQLNQEMTLVAYEGLGKGSIFPCTDFLREKSCTDTRYQ